MRLLSASFPWDIHSAFQFQVLRGNIGAAVRDGPLRRQPNFDFEQNILASNKKFLMTNIVIVILCP